jgi:hypothetical protein
MILLIRQSSPPSLLGPNILLSTLFSNTLNLCPSVRATRPTHFQTPFQNAIETAFFSFGVEHWLPENSLKNILPIETLMTTTFVLIFVKKKNILFRLSV